MNSWLRLIQHNQEVIKFNYCYCMYLFLSWGFLLPLCNLLTLFNVLLEKLLNLIMSFIVLIMKSLRWPSILLTLTSHYKVRESTMRCGTIISTNRSCNHNMRVLILTSTIMRLQLHNHFYIYLKKL